MTRLRVFQITLFIWATCFVASFVIAWLTPARDFGFTAGLNRATTFLGWQFVAAMLAVGLWVFGKTFATGSLARRVSYVPASIGLLLLAGLAILFLWVMLTKPFPEQIPVMSPKTQTQPTVP